MRSVLARLARGARRLRAPLIGVVAITVVVTAVTLREARRGSGGDRTVGEVVRVGVREGDSIPRYVESSRAELARLSAGEVYALVSFSSYLAPDQLAPVVGGTTLAMVVARVPLPGEQTELVWLPAYRVPDDVTAGMDEVARRKEAAADTGADPLAAAEARAYRAHCACVYAVVVRAASGALAAVAALPQVRAVDPAPEVRRLDRTVFLPPLPEQTDLVRPPGSPKVTAPAASPAGPRR